MTYDNVKLYTPKSKEILRFFKELGLTHAWEVYQRNPKYRFYKLKQSKELFQIIGSTIFTDFLFGDYIRNVEVSEKLREKMLGECDNLYCYFSIWHHVLNFGKNYSRAAMPFRKLLTNAESAITGKNTAFKPLYTIGIEEDVIINRLTKLSNRKFLEKYAKRR